MDLDQITAEIREYRRILKRRDFSPALICCWNGSAKPDIDGMRARLIMLMLSERVD